MYMCTYVRSTVHTICTVYTYSTWAHICIPVHRCVHTYGTTNISIFYTFVRKWMDVAGWTVMIIWIWYNDERLTSHYGLLGNKGPLTVKRTRPGGCGHGFKTLSAVRGCCLSQTCMTGTSPGMTNRVQRILVSPPPLYPPNLVIHHNFPVP